MIFLCDAYFELPRRSLGNTRPSASPFVIAHRLSTVRKASRILVFDAGRIVETGTLDELLMAGGRFAGLARAQFIAADPTVVPARAG